jgi:hypothetical protein
MSTLTERELNRALLARQGLMERSAAPLPQVLESMGGLQAQYAPSIYIGLWSRVEGLERDAVTRALERRAIVQGTLMRVTIHVVSRRDYWPIALAVREARRTWFLKSRRKLVDEAVMVAAADKVRAQLAEGPLRRKQIQELVGKTATEGVGLWVDMVRVPPSGTWERRRADLYGLAEDWVGSTGDTAGQAGVELLVRRYLGAFGPATAAQIANWAGLPKNDLTPTLEGMKLRAFRGPAGAELVDLPGAPLPDADTPVPVRFLPTWDATLIGHARRAGVLPQIDRSKVFDSSYPQSFPTFLVDGVVAGKWRHEGGRIQLDPFGKLDARTRRELDAEGGRLAEFMA